MVFSNFPMSDFNPQIDVIENTISKHPPLHQQIKFPPGSFLIYFTQGLHKIITFLYNINYYYFLKILFIICGIYFFHSKRLKNYHFLLLYKYLRPFLL
jgi:hypothetical protein